MSKRIWIDEGHGGNDPGACGNGLQEAAIVLDVCNYLVSDLKRHGFIVERTRTSNTTHSLSDRSTRANNWGADAFVSVHCNSAVNNSARGIETYAYNEKYSALAKSVQNALVENKSLYYSDRGVKYENYHVLRETKMDAALVELAFISNSDDAKLLLNHKKAYAQAICKGICKNFGIAYKPEASSSPSSSNSSSSSPAIKVGDSVKVIGNNYATGQSIPSWVKSETYKVIEVSSNKALLGGIMSWVYFNDLSVVGGQTSNSNSSNSPKAFAVGTYQRDVVVTADVGLSVRDGRGTSFRKIGALNCGERVNVWYIDKANDGSLWGSIGYAGTTGYIHLGYTKPV